MEHLFGHFRQVRIKYTYSVQNVVSYYSVIRFGAELVELYKSDVVSEYLRKHVESEKCIYQ